MSPDMEGSPEVVWWWGSKLGVSGCCGHPAMLPARIAHVTALATIALPLARSRIASRRDHPATSGRPLLSRDHSDADLLGATASRDAQALAALYDRYAAGLNGLALRITGDAADAEEVVGDVFAQVWRDASRFDA